MISALKWPPVLVAGLGAAMATDAPGRQPPFIHLLFALLVWAPIGLVAFEAARITGPSGAGNKSWLGLLTHWVGDSSSQRLLVASPPGSILVSLEGSGSSLVNAAGDAVGLLGLLLAVFGFPRRNLMSPEVSGIMAVAPISGNPGCGKG